MKIIELLNKIANGHLLNLQDYYYMDDEENATWKIWWYDLNDEVEIIEEDKKIEKLHTSIDYTGAILSLTDIETRNKINEIIDKINSMEVK